MHGPRIRIGVGKPALADGRESEGRRQGLPAGPDAEDRSWRCWMHVLDRVSKAAGVVLTKGASALQ